MTEQIPESVLEWLLSADNQPVRYLTLTHLMGRPQSDPEVKEAEARCGEYAPTRTILSQCDEYRDDGRGRAYRKYTGRYWQLIFLGQYRADGRDSRVRELAERLIEKRDWSLIPRGSQCLTSYLLSALSLLGYGGRPTVKEAIVSLAEGLVRDGGIACEVMEYSLLPHCYMAQPKLLLCFASNDEVRGHPSVARATDMIRRNLTTNQIHVYVPGNRNEWLKVLAKKPDKARLHGATVKSWVRDRKKRFLSEKGPGKPVAKPGWLRFGFPLHYNSDLLEALYALALCGAPADKKLGAPLDLLRGKMDSEGRWILESSLNGKMRADVETVGSPSKWLTYRAWYALRHFEGARGKDI
jgi:hypothetical protein